MAPEIAAGTKHPKPICGQCARSNAPPVKANAFKAADITSVLIFMACANAGDVAAHLGRRRQARERDRDHAVNPTRHRPLLPRRDAGQLPDTIGEMRQVHRHEPDRGGGQGPQGPREWVTAPGLASSATAP